MNNNGYIYYKKYFKSANIKNLNSEILGLNLGQPEFNFDLSFPGNYNSFELTTQYPGLLIGSGYGHDYKSASKTNTDEAFKIGFYFEHTSGLPIVPGSSLKGKLRNCFPRRVDPSQGKKDLALIPAKVHFLNEYFSERIGRRLSQSELDTIEDEIFNGNVKINNIGRTLSVYGKDIFYGAKPFAVLNHKNQLFDTDTITPHKNVNRRVELDEFSEPNPIKFLKVSPNVRYRFEFDLKDSKQAGFEFLTAHFKLELFKHLIVNFGIGAKTNVGYGQFI